MSHLSEDFLDGLKKAFLVDLIKIGIDVFWVILDVVVDQPLKQTRDPQPIFTNDSSLDGVIRRPLVL